MSPSEGQIETVVIEHGAISTLKIDSAGVDIATAIDVLMIPLCVTIAIRFPGYSATADSIPRRALAMQSS